MKEPQFPKIERVTAKDVIGVKTYVGDVEFGNVAPITYFRAGHEEDKQEWFRMAEERLRAGINNEIVLPVQ